MQKRYENFIIRNSNFDFLDGEHLLNENYNNY
jgi:hypothetical protein